MIPTNPIRASLFPLLLTIVLALKAGTAFAAAELGALTCQRIAGSGVNLLVTSSARVRCVFSGSGGAEQWYAGETGIKLGLDLKFGGEQQLNFIVISSTADTVPEGDFLSGKYRGGKAGAAFGIGLGAAVLLGGSRDTVALKPAIETATGAVGVDIGLGFLDLEPDPLNRARIVTPRGSVYEQTLYAGYFELAFDRYHRDPADYNGSDYFAGRALASATGQAPAPERIATLGLTGKRKEAAEAARGRLARATPRDDGMAGDAASAQVAYDCWLFALANEEIEMAAPCLERLELALSALEAAAAAAAAKDVAEMVRRPLWLRVLFATDSDELDADAQRIVDAVAARLALLLDATVHVTGHADQPGAPAYNQSLSERRARAVQAALVEAGVPQGWIRTEALGETSPLPVGPYDALNRRVDIAVRPLLVNEAAIKREAGRASQ